MSTSTLISTSVRPTLTLEDVQSVMMTVSKCLARVGLGQMQIIGRPASRPGWRPRGFSAVCRFSGDVTGILVLDVDRSMVDILARRFVRHARSFSDSDRIQALEILADLVVTDAIRCTHHRSRLLAPDSVDLYRPGLWEDDLLEQFPMAVMPVQTPCGECRLAYSIDPAAREYACDWSDA